MVHIVRLDSDQAFAAGWWLDWGQDPQAGANTPARRCPVGDILGLRSAALNDGRSTPPLDYPMQGMRVRVSGPQIDLRFCGPSPAFDCNHCTGDGLLVVPRGQATADGAPLRIAFEPGVRAVGSFIAGGSAQRPVGAPYAVRLWVRLQGNQTFQTSVVSNGVTGAALPSGDLRTAPFLGARDQDGGLIVEACFDLSPTGRAKVEQLALAQLYGLD